MVKRELREEGKRKTERMIKEDRRPLMEPEKGIDRETLEVGNFTLRRKKIERGHVIYKYYIKKNIQRGHVLPLAP